MFTLAAQSSPVNGIVLVLIYALIFGGFWFLFIRPQKKEQKRVQAMLSDMAVGDSVVTTSGFYGVIIDMTEEDVIVEMEVGDTVLTSSGFYGVIIDISDDDLIVEFGNNKNCRIPMQKAAIAQVEKASAE